MRATGCAVIAIAVVTGCSSGGAPAGSRAATSTPATAAGSQISLPTVIDADTHETFAPPPAGTVPQLSAAQAWRASQQMSRGHHEIRPIPATTQAILGLVTSPPSITDVLAWGYRSGPYGCRYTGTYQPKHPPQCYSWEFLSARTGRFLEGTQQEVRLIHVTPTPIPTQQLLRAGFIGGDPSRYAPTRIEYQAPESVIRWTFDETQCRIQEHWFDRSFDAASPSRAACPWRHAFRIDAVRSFPTHDGDFEVVAGHQTHRYGEYVRATLSNGTTALYTYESDAAWIFVVQRCGTGGDTTAITRIDEVTAKGKHLIATVAIPSTPATCP